MTDVAVPALAELTTLRVGGRPLAYLAPATEAGLIGAARELWASGEPTVILAGGSNTLAPDDELDATVLHVVTRGIEQLSSDDGLVHLRVQAGEPWDAVVALAVERGWAGLEALSGIPGSAGAVPVQNVGAYGVEVASVLVAIEILDPETFEQRRLPASALGLGYRSSIFKRGFRGLITAVELALRPGGRAEVAYAQLAAALGVPLGQSVDPALVRESVLALRRAKGMVLDDADHDTWSAGSFFTNPIVSASFARELPVDAPRWGLGAEQPADGPELAKLSAAWLIEHAGIGRGFALPGSRGGVSGKHTLALTNRGGATAAELLELAGFIQARVSADFGVELAPEPTILGAEPL